MAYRYKYHNRAVSSAVDSRIVPNDPQIEGEGRKDIVAGLSRLGPNTDYGSQAVLKVTSQ